MEDYIKEKIEKFVKDGVSSIFEPSPLRKDRVKYKAAYILRHAKTGKIYVGSSGDLLKRNYYHLFCLRKNRHHCKALQLAFKTHPSLTAFSVLVDTREEAYDIEQWCLDRYRDTGLLFNISLDARIPGKGIIGPRHTESFKLFMSKRHKNKFVSEETKQRMSLAHKAQVGKYAFSEKAKQAGIEASKRKVLIDGVEYNSVVEGAQALGIGEHVLRWRIKNTDPKWAKFSYSKKDDSI